MKKQYILGISIFFLLLSGCSNTSQNDTNGSITEEKQPFFINVVNESDMQRFYTLKKTGKISSSSEVTVQAQLGGRVSGISRKIGDQVPQGATVVQLQDSTGVYSFGAQRASAAITQTQIAYEQTMQNLQKAIEDTQFGIDQARNQAENAALSNEVSAANLQLQSAQQSFERAKIDYQTKLMSDEQTLSNFVQTAKTLVSDIQLLYDIVITETDTLLGVSDLRKNGNDSFEFLLGARNTATKTTAEDLLRKAIRNQDNIKNFLLDDQTDQLTQKLSELIMYANELQTLLQAVDTMLQHTITGTTYPESQLAMQQSTITSLQSQVLGKVSAITNQINTINSFLRTYKDSQTSLAKAVDLAEQSYQTAQANLQTAERNTVLQVGSLENTLASSLQNKEITQRSLQNNLLQAQIAYNEASFQLEKLRTPTPIAGTITDILVDVGEQVSPGTPLYTMSSVGEQTIEITLTQEEVQALTVDMPVEIRFGAQVVSGVIREMSQSPTIGVSYKAVISTLSREIPSGSIVDIYIEQPTAYPVIPLNWVRLLSTTQGSLTLRDGRVLSQETVTLGQLKGREIEIVSQIPVGHFIVTSDTRQFDPERYIIEPKIQEQE